MRHLARCQTARAIGEKQGVVADRAGGQSRKERPVTPEGQRDRNTDRESLDRRRLHRRDDAAKPGLRMSMQ